MLLLKVCRRFRKILEFKQNCLRRLAILDGKRLEAAHQQHAENKVSKY